MAWNLTAKSPLNFITIFKISKLAGRTTTWSGNRTVRRYSNSPAPPKRLLNVTGEPPIQYYEAHRRNAYQYHKATFMFFDHEEFMTECIPFFKQGHAILKTYAPIISILKLPVTSKEYESL